MADAAGSSSNDSIQTTKAEQLIIKARDFDSGVMNEKLKIMTEWLMASGDRKEFDLVEIKKLRMRAADVRIGMDIISSGSVAEAPADDVRELLRRYYQYVENYTTVYLAGCIAGSKLGKEGRRDDSLFSGSAAAAEPEKNALIAMVRDLALQRAPNDDAVEQALEVLQRAQNNIAVEEALKDLRLALSNYCPSYYS